MLHLATHGYDRAIMLVPTWLLLIAWVTAASFTVTGQLPRDLVPPALIGGLVLIVMLIGFTVMQHAFAGGAFAPGQTNETERRALALSGAGDIVFDWDVTSDKIYVSPEVEHQLGLRRGALEGAASDWLDLIHPFDKDRYRSLAGRGDRAAAGASVAGFPPARIVRRASLVPPEGTARHRHAMARSSASSARCPT